jgi:hypothetical protein
MLLLLALLNQSPAQAESFHLPPEMSQKVDEASSAAAEGMRTAKRKLNKAEQESDLLSSLAKDAGKIWSGVKRKSRSALVYLDHELHEHVLGPDSGDAK